MSRLRVTKKDLAELKKEKLRNYKSNMEFVDLQAKFILGKNNREWSLAQKRFIDSVHAANRRLRIKFS